MMKSLHGNQVDWILTMMENLFTPLLDHVWCMFLVHIHRNILGSNIAHIVCRPNELDFDELFFFLELV